MIGMNRVELWGNVAVGQRGPAGDVTDDDVEILGYYFTVDADGTEIPVVCIDSRVAVIDRLMDAVSMARGVDVRGKLEGRFEGSATLTRVRAEFVILFTPRGPERFSLNGKPTREGGRSTREGGVRAEGVSAHTEGEL